MQLRRRLVPPRLWTVFGIVGNQAVASAVSVLTTLFLVRLLGVAAFGEYAIVLVLSFSLGTLGNALVNQPMASSAAVLDDEGKSAVINAAGRFVLWITLGLVALGGLWSFLSLNVPAAPATAALTLFMTAATFSADYLRRSAFLLSRRKLVWLSDVVRYVAQAASFFVLAVLHSFDARAYSGCLAVAIAVSSVPLLHLARSSSRGEPVRFSGLVRSQGSWLSVSALLQIVNDQMFIITGSLLLGPAAVGIVRVSQQVVSVVNPLLVALEYIVPNWFGGELQKRAWPQAIQLYLVMAMAVAGVCALGLACIAAAGPYILTSIVGVTSPRGNEILWALCALWELNCFTLLLNFLLRASGRTHSIFVSMAIAAALSVTICVPVISTYGALGIVLGSLAAQLTAVVSLAIAARRHLTGGMPAKPRELLVS